MDKKYSCEISFIKWWEWSCSWNYSRMVKVENCLKTILCQLCLKLREKRVYMLIVCLN